MKRRTRSRPTTSASRTSTSGSTSDRRASMSAWILLMSPPYSTKKRALRPLPKSGLPGAKSYVSRVAAHDVCRTRSGRLPRPVAIDPVLAALGVHVGRQRERLARLRVAPQHHQRALEAEQRVVVGRGAVDDRLELGPRLLEAARPEVRPPKRLADRGLVGLEITGLRQRHRRLVEVPVLQQRHPSLIEVVDIVHRIQCRPDRAPPPRRTPYLGGRAHQARIRPKMPPPRPSSDRSPRRCARVGWPGSSRERLSRSARTYPAAAGVLAKRSSSACRVVPGAGSRRVRLSARSSSLNAGGAPRRQRRSASQARPRTARTPAATAGIRHQGAGSADTAVPAPRSETGSPPKLPVPPLPRLVPVLTVSEGWLRAGESAGVGSNVSQPQSG